VWKIKNPTISYATSPVLREAAAVECELRFGEPIIEALPDVLAVASDGVSGGAARSPTTATVVARRRAWPGWPAPRAG